MAKTLVIELLVALAYGVVGIGLMAVGYVLVDIATPGKLKELIWVERNRNAAILLCSGLLGVGVIVTAAIFVSGNDFGKGILSTLGYGLLGLILMALAFFVLDMATPGRLGDILADPQPHPAAWVSAVVQVAVAAIIAAAIS